MDLAELKKAFVASRTLTVPDGDWRFTLAVPTDVELMRLAAESEKAGDSVGLFNYRLVQQRLIAWEGVREADVLPVVGAAGPVADSPLLPLSQGRDGSVELFLSTRPALVGRLSEAVTAHFEALKTAQEAARKN